VHAELVLGMGEQVNRKPVTRLMRQAGLQGLRRCKGCRILVNQATEEDLARRQFHMDALDSLWLTDITEHPTADGKLYCVTVMDARSRRIIG
jgi:putative transposase